MSFHPLYSEDSEDFEDDLLHTTRGRHPAFLADGFFGRRSNADVSTHAILETQARYLGLAVIKECRTIPFPAGVSELL